MDKSHEIGIGDNSDCEDKTVKRLLSKKLNSAIGIYFPMLE